MDPAANQRVAPNRVALILGLLLAVWLVFEFYPRKQPVPPLAPVAAESKLHAVGLADYTDWQGLPEFFAVWAGHAEWQDGRSRFAYWHPVMKTYSYFFEATRDGAGFRFKEIAEPHDPDHFWDESLGDDCPIRFYHSRPAGPKSGPVPEVMVPPPSVPTKVQVDLNPPTLHPETPVAPDNIKPKP